MFPGNKTPEGTKERVEKMGMIVESSGKLEWVLGDGSCIEDRWLAGFAFPAEIEDNGYDKQGKGS